MIEYFIRKKKLTIFIFAMALVFGIFELSQLPRQEMPRIIQKTALVTTVYPGAGPEKVEQDITIPLEQKFREVEHIKTLESTSEYGLSTITVETEGTVNAEEIWQKIRQKIDDLEASLPKNAQKPVINENLNKTLIHSYAITADSPEQLYALNDLITDWKKQISTVSGVAQVIVQGLPEQEVRIQMDADKLRQYQITWEQLMQAVQHENERTPLGSLDYDEMTYQLHVEQSRNVSDLNRIMISKTAEGVPVYLEDVSTVLLAHSQSNYMAYYNGEQAIVLTVMGNTGADVERMYEKVNREVLALKDTLPKDYRLHTLFSQSDRIDDIFHHLTREMLFAIASVILVCTLGLNLVTSFVVALAIPISIAIGLIILPMIGVTLNQITVIGLIIVMGILVDDAVVVNDNIERRSLTFGESPKEAALRGTKEVAISILTATLALVAAFGPLLFMTGDAGSLAKPLPYAVIFTLLASMLMSLTIIPIFREWHGNRAIAKKEKRPLKPPGLLGKQIDQLRDIYAGKLVPQAIQRPGLYAAGGLLISTLLYGLVLITSLDLFPGTDDPQLSINVRMPVGTSLEETREITAEIAEWVRQQPHVKTVTYAAGGNAPMLFQDMTADDRTGPTIGQVAVMGEEEMFDAEGMVKKWSAELPDRYPGQTITLKIPKLGLPLGKPVSIRIAGNDLNQLQNLSQTVKKEIMNTEGTLDVHDNMENERYLLDFQITKQAMDHYQVSYSNLTNTLLLLGNGLQFSEFDTGSDLVQIKLSLDKADQNPKDLFQQLNVTNAAGLQIPLTQLVEMKPSFATQKINHYNLKRTISIDADVYGRTANEVVHEVKGKMNHMVLPPGYTWEVDGEISGQNEILLELGKLFIVVIFLIFFLIFLQFYSFSAPLIILTTVFLAVAGGLLGLFLMNMPVSFMGVLGVMALAGIVVRNGIVLLEFIEDARREGAELNEAILSATRARFRPILLTSVTAIVGMIPIAAIGEILFKPLAFTIIFGLIYSTLLTLFVVPSLYLIIAKFKLKRQNKNAALSLDESHSL
ncbi:efflux RND transporter permease subunit [Paenibacillus macerans]|uniref:efflux RND transporter permease subunit n=1 Tax=Paenibacillus macerans TaxID=44252 RepID=UPI00203F5862|nr:efflux RND transporter permease subunit [Paenibacillus macerans]MCM3700000.1 efflux RND transporter permease subunit [Paenibacillus macerans]